VVQEALVNVMKHSRAKAVDIALAIGPEQVLLTIDDDGVGAAPESLARPKAHGIAGMRQRVRVLGGRLDVTTAPNGGMRIRVHVPLAGVMQSAGSEAPASDTLVAIP
jgi:signal transduction histidine kinase